MEHSNNQATGHVEVSPLLSKEYPFIFQRLCTAAYSCQQKNGC